jgi:SAM-dependent methyltransferase
VDYDAPRYLLRKATVLELLRGRQPGRFLELGHGGGEMLVTLAGLGFRGVGYDLSPLAREVAGARLAAAEITDVTVATKPPAGPFDYIFFFEVIDYWNDPVAELRRLAKELAPAGRLIFSFLNLRQQGAADRLTGNNRGFTRVEVLGFLEQAGLQAEAFWNYRYPLANLLKPALNLYHRARALLRPQSDTGETMRESGLFERQLANQIAGALFNPVVLVPFERAQRWFRGGDRGSGYVVLARPRTVTVAS